MSKTNLASAARSMRSAAIFWCCLLASLLVVLWMRSPRDAATLPQAAPRDEHVVHFDTVRFWSGFQAVNS